MSTKKTTTASSKKTKSKPQKKSRKKKKSQPKPEVNYYVSMTVGEPEPEPVDEYVDEAFQAEMDEEQLNPKPVADNIRFIDPMPGCTEPELYESFDNGRFFTVANGVSGRQIFQMRDHGNGVEWKYGDEPWKSMDYATLAFLRNISGMMDAMQGNIFSDEWWVGPNGKIAPLTSLLQNFKKERKTN